MKSEIFWSEIGSGFFENRELGTPPPTIPGGNPAPELYAAHLPLVAIGEAAKDFCKRQRCLGCIHPTWLKSLNYIHRY